MEPKEKTTPPEVRAKMLELMAEIRKLDAEIDSELASMKAGLLALKQEVINKLADRTPADTK
jgi:hypothetical protein